MKINWYANDAGMMRISIILCVVWFGISYTIIAFNDKLDWFNELFPYYKFGYLHNGTHLFLAGVAVVIISVNSIPWIVKGFLSADD